MFLILLSNTEQALDALRSHTDLMMPDDD